jgi:iron(III) transport system ATP-binding protein/putative spermidine/putrescine transport system ATP-binding protein
VKQDETVIRLSEVRMENVGKRYGATWAVKDVSLSIRPGEFYTLLGPSGCGKTTLLRMLAGFAMPDEGRIFVDDEPIDPVPPWKRNLGMVFQQYALWPHMSVFENVAFGLRERRVSGAELTRKVKAALAQVGLEGFESRRPTQLSGGQQQRVALARTLVIQPRLLLLDEPLSNLDAQLRSQMRLELARLHRDLGITTLYATHDQAEALSLSTRIAVLSNGAPRAGRPPRGHLLEASERVRGGIRGRGQSRPRARGRAARDGGGGRDRRRGAPPRVGGRACVVGGRPGPPVPPTGSAQGGGSCPRPGGIPGTVTAHVFEGSRQLYDVTIPGGMIRVEMITSALVGRSFKLGDHVRVEVSPETSILLPDDRGAA